MSDEPVLQKTVSRRITLSCGHQQRIKVAAPTKVMKRSEFDAWATKTFTDRASEPCPSCAAVDQSRTLDITEARLADRTGVVLNRFTDEPLSTGTYARALRADYFAHVEAVLAAEMPLDTSVTYLLMATVIAGGKPLDGPAQDRMVALMTRYLLDRANSKQPKFWISNKQRLLSTAERDVRNPELFLPALLVAVADYPSIDAAYAAYLALLRPATDHDKDIANVGVSTGLPLADLIDRIAFMHALVPEAAHAS